MVKTDIWAIPQVWPHTGTDQLENGQHFHTLGPVEKSHQGRIWRLALLVVSWIFLLAWADQPGCADSSSLPPWVCQVKNTYPPGQSHPRSSPSILCHPPHPLTVLLLTICPTLVSLPPPPPSSIQHLAAFPVLDLLLRLSWAFSVPGGEKLLQTSQPIFKVPVPVGEGEGGMNWESSIDI